MGETSVLNTDIISCSDDIENHEFCSMAEQKNIPIVGGNVHIGLWTENVIEGIIKKFRNATLITCRKEVIDNMK